MQNSSVDYPFKQRVRGDDVYMIDLINGEFPANKSDTEEERRLFMLA